MTKYHEIIANLCPVALPSKIQGNPIPNIYHCVGTDKLIGEHYGKAILENISCRNSEIEGKISLLGVLLRAYIVIDDFIRDKNILLKGNHILLKWLENIKNKTLETIGHFDNTPNDLWNSYFSEYNNAYYNFDINNIFESIIKKCYLIFIPFSLEQVSTRDKASETCFFMKNYLFALQLLDDFQDMEEDINSPKNHNIFLSSIDKAYINTVITNKSYLIKNLLEYIYINLNSINNITRGKTIKYYISKNLEWLEMQLTSDKLEDSIVKFEDSFTEFRFQNVLPIFISNIPHKSQRNTNYLKEIRAENMHTVTK